MTRSTPTSELQSLLRPELTSVMKNKVLLRVCLFISLALLLITLAINGALAVAPFHAAADLVIYDDALQGDWQNWTWDTQVNLAATNPVHSGTAAIAVTHSTYGGLQLGDYNHTDAGDYDTLHFWIHGGSGGPPLEVQISNGSDPGLTFVITPTANTWSEVNLSLIGLSNRNLYTLVWRHPGSSNRATYTLDDIRLTTRNLPTPTPTPTRVPNQGPALSVDVTANRHAISSLIYGINFGDEQVAVEAGLTLRRWGGNHTSRYNYQNNTSNTGMDWYYENILQDQSAEEFIKLNQSRNLATILTLPLTGWVSKAGKTMHPFDCGFKLSKYGTQQAVDPWDNDCGNGKLPNGANLTGNDPADTSLPADAAFNRTWVEHLVDTFGPAAQNGVRFYALDNEPMLWYDTHRDVHPQPTNYDELLHKGIQTAAAVKAADPSAQVLGPVLWGWTAYFWSALDWETPPDAEHDDWWEHPQDRLAHGNTPFVAWYLAEMKAYEETHGLRLLDYLDLHYYPQAEGVALSGAGDAVTQARRLRSTRSLWDPTYSDESWIGEPVVLIPRMRAWVESNYPGTRLAITEYNWGALDHINGALAQADVLGIFGREGLDLATLWSPPAANDPGMFAFRVYRNYDGAGGRFGDLSVSAQSGDAAALAIYAALRQADGALTLMVINKSTTPLVSALTLNGFAATSVQGYQYSAQNLNGIEALPGPTLEAGGFSATYPAESITLWILPPERPIHKVYLPLSRR